VRSGCARKERDPASDKPEDCNDRESRDEAHGAIVVSSADVASAASTDSARDLR